MMLFLDVTGKLLMTFELLLDKDEVFIILEPTEYQEFDFAMKRIIHNEMLDYYFTGNWNRVITHCRELKGEFGGSLDQYYSLLINRAVECKRKELLSKT